MAVSTALNVNVTPAVKHPATTEGQSSPALQSVGTRSQRVLALRTMLTDAGPRRSAFGEQAIGQGFVQVAPLTDSMMVGRTLWLGRSGLNQLGAPQ
jgi:hypothetical protein